MEIAIIIFETLLLLIFGFRLFKKKKYSGRLIIDEARDSWQIAITEDPKLLKLMDSIELKIEKITEDNN